MTIQEMHQALNLELQTLGHFTNRGAETEEIDIQINAQIELFVEAVIDKHKGRVLRIGIKEGFQSNQIRLDDLKTIHMKDLDRTLSAYETVNYKFDLPDDYAHFIKGKVNYSVACDNNGVASTNTGTSQIRLSESENIENMRVHPFYKGTKESPLAEMANNTVYIYTEGEFTLSNPLKLDYIQIPAVVKFAKDGSGNYDAGNSVHCNLPQTTHRTIIRMTALHISSIIESNQLKINNLEREMV